MPDRLPEGRGVPAATNERPTGTDAGADVPGESAGADGLAHTQAGPEAGPDGLAHPQAGTDGLSRLQAVLRDMGDVVVAFSGGADSALLAKVAHDTLGPHRARAVTAVSPSLAPEEQADCAALAKEWGLSWTAVVTDELADPAYQANDGQRCYHCKSTLMAALQQSLDALQPSRDALQPSRDAQPETAGRATIVLGVNLDDLADHRPGQQAAAERGARFPFVEAGLTKADVRAISRGLGLRTWDKPAAACLASRVPYGTPVTLTVLTEVARAESNLRRLGLAEAGLRVRHYGDLARLEVPVASMDAVMAQRQEVVDAVRAAGYRYVTLDLEGLRSGNLNLALEVTR